MGDASGGFSPAAMALIPVKFVVTRPNEVRRNVHKPASQNLHKHLAQFPQGVKNAMV